MPSEFNRTNWDNPIHVFLFILILVGFTVLIFNIPSKNQRLVSAVFHNNTNQVVELIKEGADINCALGRKKTTPLMDSISANHPETAKLLLAFGADKDQEDINGNTAANYAKDAGWTNWLTTITNVVITK